MGIERIDRIDSAKLGWDVIEEQRLIHVIPVADVVFHEQTEDCPCQPSIEVCLGPEGEVTQYWLVTHNAWDGRV